MARLVPMVLQVPATHNPHLQSWQAVTKSMLFPSPLTRHRPSRLAKPPGCSEEFGIVSPCVASVSWPP
jgi:hypothetical protein